MKAQITIGGRDYRVDFSEPVDLSIRLNFNGPQPNAFHLPNATSEPFRQGAFVGDVRHGGDLNCHTLRLCPHGNGTHTECVGHISRDRVGVSDILKDTLIAALVVSVTPVRMSSCSDDYEAPHDGSDLVVSRVGLERAWAEVDFPFDAVILRTLPNDVDKRTAVYSGRSPVYLTTSAMTALRQRGVKHLLVDFPSVDREEDEGLLPNHHIFWDVPLGEHILDGVPSPRTITEMAFVPNELDDGPCLLTIQVPDFASDAAPSRPRVFRLQ